MKKNKKKQKKINKHSIIHLNIRKPKNIRENKIEKQMKKEEDNMMK